MNETRTGAVATARHPGEALEPLAARLRAAADAAGPLGVAPDLRASGDGWFPAAELTRPGERLAALVAETGRRWEAPPHVAAALWWKSFSYWTALPVAIGWALNRRVPLLTAETTMLSTPAAEPGMLVAMSEPRSASGDVGELGAVIAGTLLRELHAPVIDALHRLTRAGRRGLWGSAAEALVHPLHTFAGDLLDDPAGAARTLLESVGEPVAGLVEFPGMRRRTCCLWVTLGRGICPTCCVDAPEDAAPPARREERRNPERRQRSAGARS